LSQHTDKLKDKNINEVILKKADNFCGSEFKQEAGWKIIFSAYA
jgi:hypothetical protein